MSVVRRRYYTWLVRAYFKRWYKVIFTSLVVGAGAFFLFAFVLNFYILPVVEKKVQKIGYVGTFASSEIPEEILRDVSYGLTSVAEDGSIMPAAAYKWTVNDSGREYVFHIKKGQYFHNGVELTAETLNFNFEDVDKTVIDEYTVSLSLKESYAPFLSSVAIPIFDENLAGLGEFRVRDIELNAGFVKSLVLQSVGDSGIKKTINFYPTERALKTAYTLGEIDVALGARDLSLENWDFTNWNNTEIKKSTNYSRLVTLFYNNNDDMMSNKKVRQALNYAIPEEFEKGERTYSPINPTSAYFTKPPNYGISDMEIAKELIAGESDALSGTITISTTEEYKEIAEEVSLAWEEIGMKSTIKIIDGFEENFQVLLYPINLPKDPDQYTLWHSSQSNNITKYKNLRIDKLLEDGRSTTNTDDRQTIYADFQKYLIDDVPASFLYYPYRYEIIRK